MQLLLLFFLYAALSRKVSVANGMPTTEEEDLTSGIGSHPSASDLTTDLAYLLNLAALNDSLLQSYRSSLLSTQSIMLALASGLATLVLSAATRSSATPALAIEIVISVLSVALLLIMHRIIEDRGKDVSFLHNEILRREIELPSAQRYFTAFKIYQRLHRLPSPRIADGMTMERILNSNDVQKVVHTGLSHTRKPLNRWLQWGLLLTWAALNTTILFAWFQKT